MQDPRAIILRLLRERRPGASICPSEAARQLDPVHWRDLMEQVRECAARMMAAGELVVSQGGNPVDPLSARGPIRLRFPHPPS
ncbi:MAG: DUF3253 domain-containing protein [Akkermansiaceae bacterium]|jgi:hypothetical protein|nr:DUF3253 domain-containing protein [Akkermansiaceae bacterium]